MFEKWGAAVARLRWIVLAAGLAALLFGGVWGTGVVPRLSDGGFEVPGSESLRIESRVAATVGRQDTDVVVLYDLGDRTVEDPQVREAVTASLRALPAGDVTRAVTWWDTQSPGLVSADRHATAVAVQLAGATQAERSETFDRVAENLRTVDLPGVTARLGGYEAVNHDINTQVGADLARAESLSIPLLLVLLALVFGGVVAAGLPVVIGVLAVLGAFTSLRVLTMFTDVSVFAINIVTLLGLGLAIDYGLFVVSRFREELHRADAVAGSGPGDPLPVPMAVLLGRTMATAGRTVAFSGVTVAASLLGLAVFPENFLRSMSYGGVAAVLVAMVSAVTVLPAMIAVLGRRIDRLAVRVPSRLRRRRPATAPAIGAWERLARGVMRRPWPVIVVVLLGLGVLASPVLGTTFGGIDTRMLPTTSESRQVQEALVAQFPAATSAAPVEILLEDADPAAVAGYTAAARAVDGVTDVRTLASRDGGTLLSADFTGSAIDPGTLHIVGDLRAVDVPDGVRVLVGGATAEQVDLRASLAQRLPWAGALVALTSILLLYAAFGSVVLPFKAIAMNVVSVAASFGVVVWIFQEGHLSGLLGFTPMDSIETTQPILMLAILFGLSMDYEVFLLSRVREQWDATHDNTESVARGLQATGRIITSAALLLVVVIGAFSTSGITFIKMIGVGMAVAIVIDATVVRALLVPATMRVLGDVNWWAPAPLRRWYGRHGFREAGTPVERPVEMAAG